MIKICKYNVKPVVDEDERECYELTMHFLREDLGWNWISINIWGISMKRVDRELQKILDEGYEVFKEES